jgi:hypothetical protein
VIVLIFIIIFIIINIKTIISSGLRVPLTPEQCVQDVSARAAITFSKENLAAYRASTRANSSIAQVTISNFQPAAHMISNTNSSAYITSSASYNNTATGSLPSIPYTGLKSITLTTA